MELAETVLLAGKLLFAVAGLATGVRLVQMARDETGLGIHALGAALIFVAGLSLVLLPAGQAMGRGAGTWVAGAGELAMRISTLGLWMFLWRVFRPGSRAMALMVGAGAALLLGALLWDLAVQPDLTRYDASLPAAHAVQGSLALPIAWAAIETGRAYRGARRRLALGLVDRATCERFRLWCVACAALTVICGLGVAAGEARSAGRLDLAAAIVLVRGLLYLPVAGAVGLGMFPPRAWRETTHSLASGPGDADHYGSSR